MRLSFFVAIAAAAVVLASSPRASATALDGKPIKLSTTDGVYSVTPVSTDDDGFVAFRAFDSNGKNYADRIFAQFYDAKGKTDGKEIQFGDKVDGAKVKYVELGGAARVANGAVVAAFVTHTKSGDIALTVQRFEKGKPSGRTVKVTDNVLYVIGLFALPEGGALIAWSQPNAHEVFAFIDDNGKVSHKKKKFGNYASFTVPMKTGFLRATAMYSGATANFVGQFYDAKGKKDGAEVTFLSADSASDYPRIQPVGLKNGDLAVTLCTQTTSGRCSIVVRRYDRKGKQVGEDTPIAADAPLQPAFVTALPNGGLLVSVLLDDAPGARFVDVTLDKKLKVKGDVEERRKEPDSAGTLSLTTLADGRVVSTYVATKAIYAQVVQP